MLPSDGSPCIERGLWERLSEGQEPALGQGSGRDRCLLGLETQGPHALGFLLQLPVQMGELGFQGVLLNIKEGRTFAGRRLGGGPHSQAVGAWGGRLGLGPEPFGKSLREGIGWP